MKDIRLKHSDRPDRWDWSFTWNDVDVVRGDRQLVNAVQHSILLRRGELLQEVYSTKGCTAHDNIYTLNNENEQTLATTSIETAVKEVEGVYDVQCILEKGEAYENNIKLRILTDEMQEVTINGI